MPGSTGGAAFYVQGLKCALQRPPGYQLPATRKRKWNPEKHPWFVKYERIAGTPLEKHLQTDVTPDIGKGKP